MSKSSDPLLELISLLFDNEPDPRKRFAVLFAWSKAVFELSQTQKTAQFSVFVAAAAFANFCIGREMLALKTTPKRILKSKTEAQRWTCRFFQWLGARVRFYDYYSQKLCPEQSHERIGDAAFWGFVASHRDAVSDDDVLNFIKSLSTRSDAEFEIFKKQMAKPVKERWRYPELDCWLFSIWPLVTEYKWTFRDAWLVAQRKFETNDDWKVMKTADAFGDHCKRALGLRLHNAPDGGRPENEDHLSEATLPAFAELALRIPSAFSRN